MKEAGRNQIARRQRCLGEKQAGVWRAMCLAGVLICACTGVTNARDDGGGATQETRTKEEASESKPKQEKNKTARDSESGGKHENTTEPRRVIRPSEDLDSPVTPGTLSEGTFISGARARIQRGKSGQVYAVFDKTQKTSSGQPLPAMIVLPNLNLAVLDRLIPRLEGDQQVILTGQVFMYGGVNYLLASVPPAVDQEATDKTTASGSKSSAKAPTAKSEKPETTEAGDAPQSQTKSESSSTEANQREKPGEPKSGRSEPTIEQIIEQMDKAINESKRLELPRMPALQGESEGGVATNGPAPVPGGFLVSRRGRVVRSTDGTTMFVFDSGGSSKVREGPMPLMPCANMLRMEQITSTQGEKVTFTVSGEVFLYQGKNYLLPRMYVVNRPSSLVISGQ